MNWCQVCTLFCCFGCQPSSIIRRCAFLPPEPASYKMVKLDPKNDRCGLYLHRKKKVFVSDHVFWTENSHGNAIACVMILHEKPKCTILYSHTNATDLGQMLHTFQNLSNILECNVFLYDYSGYGSSTGQPSEDNLYADIEAAFNVLGSKYNIAPEKIILYGQSIGSVPTVHLASKVNVAGVILHSALLSAFRTLFPGLKRSIWFDGLKNYDKLDRIWSPVLVIHGTQDSVVHFSHGLTIYKTCPNVVEPLWLMGGGHNDLEYYEQYYERLKTFVNVEIAQNLISRSVQ